ncbi:VOC family protein [Aliiroseovarius sp. PrR006]|uniref:VOC family protein n=1 Tax=Aliiroseovarius sp. PrR006 TaxID=2706883 RepID=UPI0013D34D02|nr:VOC family protein [Aliiroseovarius sp. PrR006]NDW54720.1 VOC family protein [Aliiroseovarius sp. PrR006]
MIPTLSALDHLVLTVADIDRTAQFYSDVLGMSAKQFEATDGSMRWALSYGDQKINLHQVGKEFDPKAYCPAAGSADLCFLTEHPLASWQDHLAMQGVTIIDGPIHRSGAQFPITSIYIRDPDGNLIEIAQKRQD